MTKITCSREITNMQEQRKKCAGIACNREVTKHALQEKKHTVREKKHI
jgi:hypothetical protein